MDNDLKYENKIFETIINPTGEIKPYLFDNDKDNIYNLLSNNIKTTDRLGIQIGDNFKENWHYQELVSAKIIDVFEDYVYCECLISRTNEEFELRKFDVSLFENLNEIKPECFIKIQLSKKPGSQRIDVIDGTGLGIERDFKQNEDVWRGLKELNISKTPLR